MAHRIVHCSTLRFGHVSEAHAVFVWVTQRLVEAGRVRDGALVFSTISHWKLYSVIMCRADVITCHKHAVFALSLPRG